MCNCARSGKHFHGHAAPPVGPAIAADALLSGPMLCKTRRAVLQVCATDVRAFRSARAVLANVTYFLTLLASLLYHLRME